MGEGDSVLSARQELEAVFANFNKLAGLLFSEAFSDQLWWDAIKFFAQANRGHVGKERKSRLLRAAVLTAAGAFEAWTNFLAEEIAHGGLPNGRRLTDIERDVLLERRRVLEGGVIKTMSQKYPALDRFLFLFGVVSDGRLLELKLCSMLKKSFEVQRCTGAPEAG